MGIYQAKVGKKYYSAIYCNDKLKFDIFIVKKNNKMLLRLSDQDNCSYTFMKSVHTEKYVEKYYAATKKKAVEKLIKYYECSIDELIKDINALRKFVNICERF